MGNHIGKEQLAKLQEIIRSKPNLVSLCGIADDATEADLSGLGMDADDAAILASELPNKGALSSLNLASNNLGQLVLPEGWTEKKEGFMNASVIGYQHTGGTDQTEHPGKPEGIIAIAAAIPDMRAMTSLHVGMNRIPGTEMKEIIAMAMRKESIKMLCEVPIKDKTLTELDVSGKNLGMEGALVVVEYLRDNGAMTSLDISDNKLDASAFKCVAEAIKQNETLRELNLASNNATWGPPGQGTGDMSGIIALADGISANGALTKLDISNNNIEQGEALQRIADLCNIKGIELDNHKSKSEGDGDY
jgi:Leucine-rich repeat (LRR) protein